MPAQMMPQCFSVSVLVALGAVVFFSGLADASATQWKLVTPKGKNRVLPDRPLYWSSNTSRAKSNISTFDGSYFGWADTQSIIRNSSQVAFAGRRSFQDAGK